MLSTVLRVRCTRIPLLSNMFYNKYFIPIFFLLFFFFIFFIALLPLRHIARYFFPWWNMCFYFKSFLWSDSMCTCCSFARLISNGTSAVRDVSRTCSDLIHSIVTRTSRVGSRDLKCFSSVPMQYYCFDRYITVYEHK